MNIEQAREIAAQCWCDKANSNKSMDHKLAESFALRLVEHTTAVSGRMPAEERIFLATRTESPVTSEMLARFQNPDSIRLLHAVMGLTTEIAGEMMDNLKKHFFYGRPIDQLNMKEEMGDADWYLNLMCDVLHTTMQLVEVANVKKLAARYGEKFSQDKALLRNLGVELDVLKENLTSKEESH